MPLRTIKKIAKRAYLGSLLSRDSASQRLHPHASTAELMARQNLPDGFARMDLFALYLAVLEASGEAEGGIQLLEKLLRVDPEHRQSDGALLEVVRRGPLEPSRFVAPRPEVDPNLVLHQDAAAVAIAIATREPAVGVRWVVPPLRGARRFDVEWLRARGFTTAEIERLDSARAEAFARLGLLPLTWPELVAARARLHRHLSAGVMRFGRGGMYQSCEELLITGQRPTRLRAEVYELDALLRPTDRVLDIGCNAGFLALHAARYAAAVDGFDVADHFIAIAREAQQYLGRANCRFTVSSFHEFEVTEPYDVVFSFAVHHWIRLPIAEYAAALRRLLRPGGLVLLESQDLATHDRDWDDKLATFCDVGYEVVRSGTLCDDGLLARQHVLLRDLRSAA